jgi:integrase
MELLTLGSILTHAGREGYAVAEFDAERLRIPADPPKVRFAPLGKATDGRRVLLTSDEVRELRLLVRERGSELIADVTDFVALTGCRRSEACRLRPGDIDLRGRSVTITEKKRRHPAAA